MPVILILYALPNGNTIEQTMGKKIKPGDDWHFDIQHIQAQTAFLRKTLIKHNIAVAYLEANTKSWPAWKQSHPAYKSDVLHIVDTLKKIIPGEEIIYLNGHSGGGRFILSYLDAADTIPSFVQRISFLDSNYGYDSSYYPKLKLWLNSNNMNALNVFAYNDSVALYNGKRIVSDAGGTWYRSHLMMKHFEKDYSLTPEKTDSVLAFTSQNKQVRFFMKENPHRIIYHTIQVERNGFIHSVLCGSKYDSKGYTYFGKRCYDALIKE